MGKSFTVTEIRV